MNRRPHPVCCQSHQYSLQICTFVCIVGVLLSTIKSSTMNLQEFTALLILTLAMSFSPGPNTTLSSALAANHGIRRSLPFICAVPVGWGALLVVCSLGIGALVLAVPLLGWAVKLVGVSYLLWLAWKIARSHQPSQAAAAPLQVSFWQGAALQFVNIKGWMMALAIVSGWIAGRDEPALRFAVVLGVAMVFTFASSLSYALAGSLLRDWLAGPAGSGRRLMWFNRAMATVLVATAVWMLFV
jgi:threonine/homoserine/homoserine lactone efflux protein